MFGIKRLQQSLAAADHNANGVLTAVKDALNRFAQGVPPDEDQTVLSIRVE